MNPIQTLVDFPGFRDGFQVGLVLAAVVLGLGWALQRIPRRSRIPFGLTGPAWVVAALVTLGGWYGYRGADVIPSELLWGLAILVAAGELAERTPNPVAIGMVLALPGALLVGVARDFPGPGWSKWLVIGVITVAAPLAGDLDRRSGRLGLGPVLWLLTVAGLYWTVPDTERVRPLIGAAVPLAFTGWPTRWSRMGSGGIGAAIGLFVWVAAIEGRGRPGSIVGAVASLGLFVVEPIGRVLARGRIAAISRSVSLGVFEWCVVGSQLVLVGYASRVSGFARTGGGAFLLLIPAIPAGIVLGGLVRVSKRLGPRRGSAGGLRRSSRTSRATGPDTRAGP